jgi:CRP/FNR family transcriptional regulator, nitrogen oxide reductase regulator
VNSNIRLLFEKSAVFSVLDAEEVRQLVALSGERNLVAAENIFWEGDASDWFYQVRTGKVRIFKSSSSGKEITLSYFGAGEIFGEVAVLEDQPYPASAQAVTAASLIGIRKADFRKFILDHPPVALKIISVLSGRLRESQSRLRDLAGERVEQRLARIMLMLSAKLGATLPFTRQELSDMAGTTTETTIRILSQWKEAGIIRSVRSQITIADAQKLQKAADGPSG